MLGIMSNFRLLLLTLMALTLCIAVQGYMGTRYGKRERFPEGPGEPETRYRGMPRGIVARSGNSRFYAGTRYAGKRSSPSNWGINDGPSSMSNLYAGPRLTQNDPTLDCTYVPYLGFRCTKESLIAAALSLESDNVKEGSLKVNQEEDSPSVSAP